MVIRQSVEFYHVRLLPQITLCFHGFRKVLNRCFLVFAPAANGSFDVPRRSMGPNAVGQLRAGRAYASARHSDFANVANCASLYLHSMPPMRCWYWNGYPNRITVYVPSACAGFGKPFASLGSLLLGGGANMEPAMVLTRLHR